MGWVTLIGHLWSVTRWRRGTISDLGQCWKGWTLPTMDMRNIRSAQPSSTIEVQCESSEKVAFDTNSFAVFCRASVWRGFKKKQQLCNQQLRKPSQALGWRLNFWNEPPTEAFQNFCVYFMSDSLRWSGHRQGFGAGAGQGDDEDLEARWVGGLWGDEERGSSPRRKARWRLSH